MQTTATAGEGAGGVSVAIGSLRRVVEREAGTGLSAEAKHHLDAAIERLDQASRDLGSAVETAASRDKSTLVMARKSLERAAIKVREAKAQRDAVTSEGGTDAVALIEVLSVADNVLAKVDGSLAGLRAGLRGTFGWSGPQWLQAWLSGAAAVIAGFAVVLVGQPALGQFWSLIFGLAVLCVAVVVVNAVSGERGAVSLIIGADNRVSTSKTQFAIWTIAFAFALAFLLGRVLFDSADMATVIPNSEVDQYLILIGGPFAAGVLAKVAVTWRIGNGSLQKSTADAASPGQLVQDDAGNASLVDAQYLAFNIVALGYFIVELARFQTLPVIPDVLLGLTSASAATYVANKLAERNAPVISAIAPRTCKPGQIIRIAGVNLDSSSEPAASRRMGVQIDGYAGELTPTVEPSGSMLSVELPLSLPAGAREVRVRTVANVLSDPYLIEVLESKPVLFGLEQPATRGAEVTARGQELVPAWVTDDQRASVRIADLSVVADATPTTVTFKVPDQTDLVGKAPIVFRRADGSTSDPITVVIS